MSKDEITIPNEYLELAQKIGSFIEYWGFKEVHGRIWTLIFLNHNPVDANYIKKHLGISKALTSMSINELLQYNVILEVKKTAPGTQKYTANTDITSVVLDVLKSREQTMLKKIKQDFSRIKKLHPEKHSFSESRQEKLGEMIETASSLLQGLTSLAQVDFNDFSEALTLEED